MSPLKELIPCLESLNPQELTLLACSFGILLTEDLTPAQKRMIGNLLFVVANASLTIAAIEDAQIASEQAIGNQTNISNFLEGQEKMATQIAELQKQIQEMQLRLKK